MLAPDIVFLHCGDSLLKNQIVASALSYVNAAISGIFSDLDGDVFDHTSVAVRDWSSADLQQMPTVFIYSHSLPAIENEKLVVQSLDDVTKHCPFNAFNKKYIPALKGAILKYHAIKESKAFILCDADIIFHQVYRTINARDIYFSGAEFSPFTCFWSQKTTNDYSQKHLDECKTKWMDIKDIVKLDLYSLVMNNGIISVPHAYITAFCDLYYEYLDNVLSSDNPVLQVPKPFWVAEMFAMNYAALTLSSTSPCRIKRFDPEIGRIYHDVPKIKQPYIDSLMNL